MLAALRSAVSLSASASLSPRRLVRSAVRKHAASGAVHAGARAEGARFAAMAALAAPRAHGARSRTLNLQRDLVAIDLETTGVLQTVDRILQVGIVRMHPDGSVDEPYCRYVYTDHPINPEAEKKHGISRERLEAIRPVPATFRELAPELLEKLADADLTGYNAQAFDRNFLRNEFARLGVAWPPADARMIDSYRIFRSHVSPQSSGGRHRLDENAVPFYCGVEHEGAHDAGADAKAALDVLREQVRIHPLPNDVVGLHDFCAAKVSWAKEDKLLLPSLGQTSRDALRARRARRSIKKPFCGRAPYVPGAPVRKRRRMAA